MKQLILTLLLIGTASLQAQNAPSKKEIPSGTLFHKRAPEFSRWVVTENPSAASEGQKLAFQRRTVVTKTKSIMHEQMQDRKGRKEKWCVGDVQYSFNINAKKFIPYTKESFRGSAVHPDKYTDYSQTDFPGFEWVDAAHFSDVRNVMKRECIVFERPGEDGGDSATACVDLATRLPVVLKVGESTKVYEFYPAPQQILPLPEQIQKELQAKAASNR